VSQIICASNVK